MLNIWQAHHDPETYENPETFDPNRFIPTEGKPRPELPVQFGMGKNFFRCTFNIPFFMFLNLFFILLNKLSNSLKMVILN